MYRRVCHGFCAVVAMSMFLLMLVLFMLKLAENDLRRAVYSPKPRLETLAVFSSVNTLHPQNTFTPPPGTEAVVSGPPLPGAPGRDK